LSQRLSTVYKSLPVLLFHGRHLSNYGHALLDNLFTIFAHLLAHDLLDTPLAVVVANSPEATPWGSERAVFAQLLSAVCEPAAVRWVDLPELLALARDGAPVLLHASPAELDPALGAVARDARDRFLRDGPAPDRAYRSTRRAPLLRAFVARLIARLGLAEPAAAADPLRAGVSLRRGSRRFVNPAEVTGALRRLGYRVAAADLASLPLRAQARLARRSAVVVSAYGAGVANAVFMRPGALAVVCWPNPDARMFWADKHCGLHTAAAALGVVVQAVDKPYYDELDRRGRGG
jgi:capsular polysaccharide biosynthesis protein